MISHCVKEKIVTNKPERSLTTRCIAGPNEGMLELPVAPSNFEWENECRNISRIVDNGIFEQIEDVTPSSASEPKVDLEKGLSVSYHAVLDVQGMTCACGESKLKKCLGSLQAVTNVQTSVVLSRLEFDLDLSLGSLGNVIHQIKNGTGFKCERRADKGQGLDVITTSAPKSLFGEFLPPGITDKIRLNQNTIRLFYDPTITGARDILECSFGAPLQVAPLPVPAPVAAGNKLVRQLGFRALFSVTLTVPVLVLAWAPLPELPLVYGAVSLALASAIQVFIVGPYYSSALKSLLASHLIDMDLLIVFGTSTAYAVSIISFTHLAKGTPLSIGQFFDTAALLTSLIMFGRFISALASQKAVKSMSMRSLQPSSAILVTACEDGEREIDARLLHYGDIIRVPPDCRIATDGVVISGASDVDESMVTGEGKRAKKHPHSAVVTGSINGTGTLNVRVTRLLGDNTVSAIADMVDEAKLSKIPVQGLADKVVAYFVPAIVAISLLTFAVQCVIGVKLHHQPASEAAIQASTYAITVLIISCPCAIGLAVPMVIAIAGGVAAEHGVVIKTATTIETARKVSHVVFDKTGTLTEGTLSVTSEIYPTGSPDETRSLLLGLIKHIKHPVSQAVTQYLEFQGVTPAQIQNNTIEIGQGISGTYNDSSIRAGNSHWLNLSGMPQIQFLRSRNLTVFCVITSQTAASPAAIFTLEDSLRPEAVNVIRALQSQQIAVSLISGDDEGPVRSVAKKLGIPTSHIKFRCLPADKQAYVKGLVDSSRDVSKTDATFSSPWSFWSSLSCGKRHISQRKPVVLFIGDGTNDALPLATADIGLHMPSSTSLNHSAEFLTANIQSSPLAASAADALLTYPSLFGLLTLMELSRAAFRRIVFNFVWAFLFNVVAVILAAGILGSTWRIPPAYAGLGEIVSVVPVIMVALGMKWHGRGGWNKLRVVDRVQ